MQDVVEYTTSASEPERLELTEHEKRVRFFGAPIGTHTPVSTTPGNSVFTKAFLKGILKFKDELEDQGFIKRDTQETVITRINMRCMLKELLFYSKEGWLLDDEDIEYSYTFLSGPIARQRCIKQWKEECQRPARLDQANTRLNNAYERWAQALQESVKEEEEEEKGYSPSEVEVMS